MKRLDHGTASLWRSVESWRLLPDSAHNRHLHRAVVAFDLANYHIIPDSHGHPYVIRFWLTVPFPSVDSSSPFESGNSHLLHWILKPDEDRHLHDHPWHFTSRILSGGYIEEYTNDGDLSRPVTTVERLPGHLHTVTVTQSHRIVSLLSLPVDFSTGIGGTWTDVRTGPRCRPWGFFTPSGWVDHSAYLGQQKITFTDDVKKLPNVLTHSKRV